MTATATPFAPALAACHAGQAARAELTAHLEQLEALERAGRKALRLTGPRTLADQADALHAAVVALQAEGCPYADGIDVAALEDVGGVLRRIAEMWAAGKDDR